jgi:hypothetical protein
MSAAGMTAVSRVLLMKFVGRGWPFQFTTEPVTNPAPLTVSANVGPPGATLVGTNGKSINGVGLDCARTVALMHNNR